MSDRTIAFAEKALEFAKQILSPVPSYNNVDELKKDLLLAQQLRNILNALNILVENFRYKY
ncbi:MAG: hypothetical protein ACPL25_03555 [Ignavibacteria bacterium]